MPGDNLRVIISKKMMKEGLLRCLANKSIDRISISELCREAQVNRATFYNHYSSSKELLEDICWDISNDMCGILRNNSELSMEDRLTKCLDYAYDNRDSIMTVFRSSLDDETVRTNMKALERVLIMLTEVNESFFPDRDEWEIAGIFYSYGLINAVVRWLDGGYAISSAQFARLIIKFLPTDIFR